MQQRVIGCWTSFVASIKLNRYRALMAFQLVIVDGADKNTCFEIEDGDSVTIGRSDHCDRKINDPAVSRVHCEVARHGDTCTIKDMSSSSGTHVDGRQIEQCELRNGAKIRIGDTVIRVGPPSGPDADTVMNREKDHTLKPLDQLVGTKLNQYEIVEVIGRGASGMVFKAWDETKERHAAVKVLTPLFAKSEEQRDRFVRAMKTMMPIRHPRIVRLFNAGISGPYCWAAMEYVPGENLTQLIERIGIEGMLDWKKVWQVATDVTQALQAGYEHKIVHRNVTPTNILRRESDEACLLGDLMLAKALEGNQSHQVTQAGEIVGDVPYLAPERTQHDGIVDTRSDIYGLGASCYALLTGRPPVDGKSLPEMIDNVRKQKPRPPKQFQLATNEMFQDVIMRMIEKEPGDRFQSPSQVLGELIRIGKFNNLEIT